MVLLLAGLAAGTAQAAVELRVEARPIGEPIEAFVTVTDDVSGNPVAGLTSAEFTVTLDGIAVPLDPSDLTLPPAQDPNQKVSVIFAMDYTSSVTDEHLIAMQAAVIAFIDAMNVGDFAAILKFNNDSGATVVQPFIAIDDAANDDLLDDAVLAPYDGDGSNILEAAERAVKEIAASTLPPTGPKAVILITDGIDTHSPPATTTAAVIAIANDNGVPIFTIGVGDLSDPDAVELLTDLAIETGGEFIPAPDDQEIAEAYASVSALLSNEYLITIPSTIDDCAEHTLDVTVAGHGSDSAVFTRRDCDVTPDAFSFTTQTGVDTNTQFTSNSVTISGIEAPTTIGITIGTYSIGCNGTFTPNDGTINNGDTVCIRHTSSANFSTAQVSTLTVGGVSSTFTTTTEAAPPPPPPGGGGGGGGGGAAGAVELLLGLFALFAMRRRRTA